MALSTVQAAARRHNAGRITHDTRLTFRGRKLALWNFVHATEIMAGSQFLTTSSGQLYVVLGEDGTIIQLPKNGGDRWFAYFNKAYGFAEHEDYSKFVYDALRHHVISEGMRVELRRFSAYDLANKTAYLSAYNGRMYKISGSDVTDVMCGEDGIFFADDDGGMHVEPDIGPHGQLLERLLNLNFAPSGLSGITPRQQQMAMTIWIFALAFPDLMPTKPLLILEGAQGSGKTSAIQLLQLALMGMMRPMILQRNKEDDFGIMLLRAPIALFDNLDSYIDWVPDAVCSYTTSGTWTRRKLYTDDDSIVIKPHAFIAVASKNPASFRREDTADRCIILRLERRETFTRAQRLQQEILDGRSALLGEYLWYVGQIVEQLRADADGIEGAQNNETHRMADFAALGRAVARVCGWPAESVEELMQALAGERDAFVNEEDPLIDLLQKWIAYPSKHGPRNVGRLVTVFQLHAEIETLASASGIPWKYSARTLAQKMRSPHLEREFIIEQEIVNNHKAYRVWRHTDTKLEVVR